MASHGTRFYDLRHFYSQLIAANLNPKVIQARPGHATVGETMDTYGHLFRTPMTSGSGPLTMRRRRASQPVGRVL